MVVKPRTKFLWTRAKHGAEGVLIDVAPRVAVRALLRNAFIGQIDL